MSTADNDKDDIPNICANCGKGEESSFSLKACTACKLVKYCNRECQIAHRSQHKKACKKRAAELHEEALFKQPPTVDDCPICFLRMPVLDTGRRYMSCCGKVVCSGCIYAPVYDDQGNEVDNQKCSFCRVPTPYTDEELVKRAKKRMETGDATAIFNIGNWYFKGRYGFRQDTAKALELWHKAAELGDSRTYYNIGHAYDDGFGVKQNEKKAIHYWELAAMLGDVDARHNLGVFEENAGNHDRALKHLMIAVTGGDNASLERIKWLYTNGHATKEDYSKALRAYQAYLKEIKSDERDKAAAANKYYKYY